MKNLIAVILVALAVNGFAQKISTRLSFQKGQKLEVVSQSNSVLKQELMGQSIDMNINATITRYLDVQNVANNLATIEHNVKRIQFSFDAMGQSQTFDSEKEEDLKSEMGKSVEKSIKNKYTMTVDDNGNVVSVIVNDNHQKDSAGAESEDMMNSMLSQFAEGLEVPKAGDPTAFKILPSGDISKGQTWTDSLTSGEKGVTKYTVSDITPSEILVDYFSEGTVEKKQETMGMEAIVVMKNKTTGKVTLDRKTGLLKQKTVTTEGSGTIEVAGQTVPMTTKTNGTITVKSS